MHFADDGANDASINATTINAAAANVVLQANNDINVDTTGAINMANAGVGLTMQAGRSIVVNADVTTSNGAISLTANETTANGVQDGNRDPGTSVITMADGVTLDAGTADITITLSTGAGLTNSASGDVTLENLTTTAGDVLVVNNGPTAGSGIIIEGTNNDGVITASSASFNANGAGGGGEVGASGSPLRLAVTNAEARADSGGIFLYIAGSNPDAGDVCERSRRDHDLERRLDRGHRGYRQSPVCRSCHCEWRRYRAPRSNRGGGRHDGPGRRRRRLGLRLDHVARR